MEIGSQWRWNVQDKCTQLWFISFCCIFVMFTEHKCCILDSFLIHTHNKFFASLPAPDRLARLLPDTCVCKLHTSFFRLFIRSPIQCFVFGWCAGNGICITSHYPNQMPFIVLQHFHADKMNYYYAESEFGKGRAREALGIKQFVFSNKQMHKFIMVMVWMLARSFYVCVFVYFIVKRNESEDEPNNID